jgi:tetratricopeptide (TPR) repeat protein
MKGLTNRLRSGGASRWRAAALAALLALGAVALPPGARAQDAGPDLELVPHPELSQLDPEARARLEPGIDFFRTQRAYLEGRPLGLAYGRIGINYLAHGQYAAAAACLHNARVLDPKNPRWPYLLGYLRQETGDFEGAVTAYRDSLKLNQSYTPGFVRLGQVLLATERVDEAAAAFEVGLDKDVNDAAGLLGLGDLAMRRGQPAQAIPLYQRGVRTAPEATVFHARLSEAYRQQGDLAAADREAAQAGSVEPAVNDPLVAFVQAHTRGAAHYREAARTADEAGDVATAVKFYEIATSIQPDDTDSLIRLGELQGAAGDLDAALATFARVALLDPDNAKANYFVGTLLERQGNEDEAARFYERALETRPELVEPRLLLANSLMRQREFDAAGEHYAQIAHQLPDNVEVQYLLGMAWLAAGQCGWSHRVLDRALSIQPGDGQVMMALARAYSICEDATAEQRQQALAAATAMYEREPGGESAETLAMAAAANGHFQDAVELQAQAMFEALRSGDESELAWLRENMEHYEAGQPASAAWPQTAEVYRPRSLRVGAPASAGG